MSKFTVNIPVVSYYEVKIDAENAFEARKQVADFSPSIIEDKGGYYVGWDIDNSNIVINEEAPTFLSEHFKLIKVETA
jgi:hypothetical protein